MINNIQDKKYGIYSYYKSNISQEIVSLQSCVFKKFEFEITQIKNDNWEHFQFLNSILNDPLTPEFILFFDIDCIPLTKESISLVLQQIQDQNTIAGGAQTANHLLDGKNLYIGPFFMAISKTVYKKLGSPCMSSTSIWDIGALLTIIAKFRGDVSIKYWMPSSVDFPKWDLYPERNFGYGTTYENHIYHAFESRWGDSDNIFIKKCKELLDQL